MTPPDEPRTSDKPAVSETHLRSAVEAAPSGLLMTDSSGKIVFVNREVERIFGYDRSEMIGRMVEMLIPVAARPSHIHTRSRFTHDPHAREMGAGRDLQGVRKDGSLVPVEVGLTPFSAGGERFVIAALVDVSERRRAERELAYLDQRLRESEELQTLGTLLGGITRQIDKLLGEVLDHAEPLAEALHDEPAVALDVAEILSASRRAKRLVDRVAGIAERATGGAQA